MLGSPKLISVLLSDLYRKSDDNVPKCIDKIVNLVIYRQNIKFEVNLRPCKMDPSGMSKTAVIILDPTTLGRDSEGVIFSSKSPGLSQRGLSLEATI